MTTTILTVNLEPGQKELLRGLFPCEDHQFIQADDPVTACRLLANGGVDMVFTADDLGPGRGRELLRYIRNDGIETRLPVVVLGNDADPEDPYCLALDPAQQETEFLGSVESFLHKLERERELDRPDKNMAASIVSATKEVMDTMLGIDLKEGKTKIERTAPHRADVIANVAVTGFLSGTVTIFLSYSMAKALSGAMLAQDDFELGDEEVVDAIGELVNMVAGNIKQHLSSKMALYTMSAPSVVIGREVRRVSLEKHLCFTIPFTWQEHRMLVEFLLLPKGTVIQPVLPGQRRT